MNDLVEPTWKEIYFLVYPRRKKKTSFTGNDLIRFFNHNLTLTEKEITLEYFCALCEEQYPDPETPMLDPTHLLPSPNIYLIPPVYISVPDPIPQLPPIYPEFLLPVWPFILIPSLPYEILKYLKQELGVNELHAAIKTQEDYIHALQDIIYTQTGQYIIKSPPRQTIDRDAWSDIDAEVYQNDAEVHQNDAEVSPDPYDPWGDSSDVWEEWETRQEDQYPSEEFEESETVGSETDEEYEEFPSPDEKLLFYALLDLLQLEGQRLNFVIIFKGWMLSYGTTFYFFTIEGDNYEFTVVELQLLLEEFKELPSPEEMLLERKTLWLEEAK